MICVHIEISVIGRIWGCPVTKAGAAESAQVLSLGLPTIYLTNSCVLQGVERSSLASWFSGRVFDHPTGWPKQLTGAANQAWTGFAGVRLLP